MRYSKVTWKLSVEILGLIHFRKMFQFYTPWKSQKISGFLMFSGSTEIEIDLTWVKWVNGVYGWSGVLNRRMWWKFHKLRTLNFIRKSDLSPARSSNVDERGSGNKDSIIFSQKFKRTRTFNGEVSINFLYTYNDKQQFRISNIWEEPYWKFSHSCWKKLLPCWLIY